MAADEAIANKAAAEAQAIKDECESDLAEAIPALEAAIEALDTLKPADITEVRAMRVSRVLRLVLPLGYKINNLCLIRTVVLLSLYN